MDIFEYIKADHKKVDHLFKQFEQEENKDRQVDIVTMIVKELEIHAHSEQETFYKLLESKTDKEEIVEHAKGEHKEIEEQIDRIVASSATVNSAWVKKVNDLKDIVQHHVKEEEGKIFSEAKKVLDEKEIFALKEQMHHYKTKILQLSNIDAL